MSKDSFSDGQRWWQTLDDARDPHAAAREVEQALASESALQAARAGSGSGEAGSRRDFFKVMGLSATAAISACHRAPVERILPFTSKPDALIPGVPLWYASSCGGCAARCGILVKTRDGRPIKIEGNPTHPVSGGAVCAVGQASLLSLYDADRARNPQVNGQSAAWADVDRAVDAGLARAQQAGQGIRLVVPFGWGPTAELALDRFTSRYPQTRVVRFDPMGVREASVAAHLALYGKALLPDFRIDAAQFVLAFDADFLGSAFGPAIATRQRSLARDPMGKTMLRHVQIESHLSLTGAAADERMSLAPSLQVAALAHVVATLAAGHAAAPAFVASILTPVLAAAAVGRPRLPPNAADRLNPLIAELRTAGPRGLLLCGSDDPAAQVLAVAANALLGNGQTTAVLDARQALRDNELTVSDLADELDRRQVGALFFLGTNPALVDGRLAAGIAGTAFSLSTSDRLDETAALTKVHAPSGHYLEAWTDHRPRGGVETMGQPCVAPLFDTRAELTSLLAWAGETADGHRFLKQRWQGDVLSDTSDRSWNQTVSEGYFTRDLPPLPLTLVGTADAAVTLVGRTVRSSTAPATPEALELVLHASVGLHDGTGPTANNGWLQELPDPISKLSWGNCAAISPARAEALGLNDGDIVELRTSNATVLLPVLRQPGVAANVIAIAVGYGRAKAGRLAAGHGADAWPLTERVGNVLLRSGMTVSVRATGDKSELALSQTHSSQEGRELVRQANLGAFRENPRAGNEGPHEKAAPRKHLGLWPGHSYEGHRWGLSIDLNRCTGCSACVVSCSAENNIAIVGAVEVQRRRDMHWLRLDRYYAGSPEAPDVLHQPMLCQHCENAPCETVCPVVATVHSSEGLNQQVYNRCVGTRYCANNCPTKVRRFNWFDYNLGGDLARMVLNPDVVVRSRGVMEKCSMCVQRIEEARASSRREGRELADGDIRTACQQSCPAEAITFGDANDPGSRLSRLRKDGRSYAILEELNVKAQVTYMTRIKNRAATDGEGGHHG